MQKTPIRRFSPVTLALLLGLPVSAQVPAPSNDQDLVLELEALLNAPVSGASKREQRLMDSPQAIEILTGEEIRKMGIKRLPDALKLMTGLDILDPDNNFTSVGMRGVMQQGQPRTVQVLIDGVPLYNNFGGSVDLGNLPVTIDSIDKVEVVRGPSSTLYGANAVVGVIAITTRKAGEGVHGTASLAGANERVSRFETGLAIGQGAWGLSAGYGGFSEGNSNRALYQVGATANPVQTDAANYPDANHNTSENVRLDWKNDHTSLWFTQGGADRMLGTCQGELATWYSVQTLLAGWHETWTSTFATEFRLHQVRQEASFRLATSNVMAYGEALALLGRTALDLSGNQKLANNTTTQLELQGNWDPAADLHFVFGADTRTSTADPVPFVGIQASDTESASGGFLSMDWKFQPQWTLSMGARLENETLGGSRTSPRVTLVYAPNPTSVFRAGYYTSTRSPQLTEMRANYFYAYSNPLLPGTTAPAYLAGSSVLPNTGITPEKTSNVELGYRQALGPVSFDLTLYRMAITNQITQVLLGRLNQAILVPTGLPAPYPAAVPEGVPIAQSQFQNQGDATNKGVEMALTYLVRKNWSFGLNGRYLDFVQDTQLPGASIPDGQFSYAPKVIVSAWTRFTQSGFTGSLQVQHLASAYVEALSATSTTLTGQRPATFQWDGQVSYELLKGLSLGAYVRNGARDYTLQGASGQNRSPYFEATRREVGASLGYRF